MRDKTYKIRKKLIFNEMLFIDIHIHTYIYAYIYVLTQFSVKAQKYQLAENVRIFFFNFNVLITTLVYTNIYYNVLYPSKFRTLVLFFIPCCFIVKYILNY